MTNRIVPAEYSCAGYQLPAEDRNDILSQIQTDKNRISTLVRAMPNIETQRQQFIAMYGDAFGLDAGN
ncbi:hypothetical protein PHO31112_04304 [Pandoraea horticolens]|uniref:Uncharacterized protein n=1 Tax=Pandoraea horticolens TaxID=2508298 RepID=A0A5E4Y671_9BURK|nr:hypothetical protein [Pandoraea horticolens]VVE44017.1 hypothetical protein PHO31112_04304 [Pandoraea horticolens]